VNKLSKQLNGVTNIIIYKWIKDASSIKVFEKEEIILRDYKNKKLKSYSEF